jgi:diadenosine tetraphosphate (Ap4A) HIT family hydrolase
MSQWTDAERWEQLVRGEGCPICRAGGPLHLLAELEVTQLSMGEDGPMRGYCCLFLKRHAVELHDLGDAEGAAFMRDVQRVSRALKEATGAVKLNYEVHGNTLPHLHVHFFPRSRGDAFEGGPINPRAVKGPVYAPGELAVLRERVRAGRGLPPAQ